MKDEQKIQQSKNNTAHRSWFCVLNNPEKLDVFQSLTPEQTVDKAIELWCKDKPQRSCAINYEIADTGTPHMHMVLEDPAKARFTSIKKLFGDTIHIEVTRGNKQQAEAYINKIGKFEEKAHTVIVPAKFKGEIKAQQGSRNDLEVIEQLIEQGLTPREIMDMSINFRKEESIIRKAFFAKRYRETPPKRDVHVYWHTGDSGAGKSYTYVKLCEQLGENNIYLMNDYDSGGLDNYCGEPVLFMDEFKGSLKFQVLLNYLEGYKMQIHCRYANAYALWNTVHITSIYPPEKCYASMVDEAQRDMDKIAQLMRRIDTIHYHYKDKHGAYHVKSVSSKDYVNYSHLKSLRYSIGNGFIPATSNPFEPHKPKPDLQQKLNLQTDQDGYLIPDKTDLPLD